MIKVYHVLNKYNWDLDNGEDNYISEFYIYNLFIFYYNFIYKNIYFT